MDTVIDLGSEVAINGSRVRNPYVRLLLAAIGDRLAAGSPWMAVNKEVAALCNFPWRLTEHRKQSWKRR